VEPVPNQVVVTGVDPVPVEIDVTLLAHLLERRAGGCRDACTLAVVVPLAGQGGMAVRRPPGPTALPIAW
jgi:hypothetical protein